MSEQDLHTVRMELCDTLALGDDLFVLAGYPHPSNDWGWSSWAFDGPSLDDSDWQQPWDDEFWRGQVTLEPEEVDLTWDDVELEYDHARVLVRQGGSWHKEALPFPCERLRELPGLGLCALGGYGVCLREDDEGGAVWRTLEDLYADDLVIGEDGRMLVAQQDEVRWARLEAKALGETVALGASKADLSACATPHGVYLAGERLFRFGRSSLERLAEMEARERFVLCTNPDLDGTAIAIATNNTLWWIGADGLRSHALTRPAGFNNTLSVACFRGVAYVAAGGTMVRADGDQAIPLSPALPSASIAQRHTWSRCGGLALRVSGGKLWATCAHHLCFTEDGEHWELVPFR